MLIVSAKEQNVIGNATTMTLGSIKQLTEQSANDRTAESANLHGCVSYSCPKQSGFNQGRPMFMTIIKLTLLP